MKNAAFWDMCAVWLLLRTDVTANVVPSSPIPDILIMEVIRSSETSALT
jgi:hypothetical protein